MKFKVIISLFVFLLSSVLLLDACKKNDADAYNPTRLTLTIPDGWPAPGNIFADNPLTEQGFQLGKKLFYDGKLSRDGNFPCASCHQQFAAFATFDHDFSHGYNNSFTTRNAPGLFNLAWETSFHRDGGINHLEVQPLAPITAINEMAETMENVIAKLKADADYPVLFKAAFGSTDINSQRLLKALAQFTGSILSYNSKYDKVRNGEEVFTASELSGYNIFKAKCNVCHQEPLFTDHSLRNNGLSVNSFLNDYGRMNITGNSNDSLKFKVPSLRNVALTFPYMHDGRFYSLSSVIDHYRTGIITTQPTLDPLLINRIPLSATEKNNLLIFLNTLTDNSLAEDPRFSER